MRKSHGGAIVSRPAGIDKQPRGPSPRPGAPSALTDLRAWQRTRLLRNDTGRPRPRACRETTLDEVVARSMRHAAMYALARGDTKPLALALSGAALPTVRLESLSGHSLALEDLCVGWLIVYCFPGSHIGNEESHRDDARDHHAHARWFTRLERRGIRLASLSSAPRELQIRAMLEHGLAHHVLLDPDLLIADALGLPTLCEDGRRAYSRLTLLAKCGVIEHVFYPVRGGRSAEQAVTWMQVHAGLESLDAG